MKSFIKKIIFFSVFGSVFYVVVLPIWSQIMPPFMAKNVRNCVGCYGHLFSRTRDVGNLEKSPDILFLGSSHAYRGFDTRVFSKNGISSFNLGSSSQSPINTQVLLKQYLDRIKPKMIVYEVYAGTLSADGVESSLDMLSNNKIDVNAIEMVRRTRHLAVFNTAIYGLYRQILGLNKTFSEPSIQNDDVYVQGGGFVETKFRKNPMLEEAKGKWELNPKQIEALKENLDYIKKRNIPYILVQAPITKKLYESKTNNISVDSLLSTMGTYKNFYGELPLNDTIDFYDSNHLNQEAVVKFNESFITYLKTLKR
ncbi:hypothetical protein CG08_0957 [Riemerella anatipestifer]|uniref:hypothetical protein n=1 Tax=Riemerella anatipestifer TaxID=34085 RepID=UPI00066ED5AE|nr:hypothetical protein [Riemerella anatipestifer]AKP69246.1 hypothetical protein CG08_0957 [Riemerella anatipestifer]MDD1525231.1 hypothetical protein [Riemerella anatipestifer]MRN04958.1 hypothetical protein [Riemerella anatipestifer]QOZ87534.1 hypothetical protein D1J34_08720 [Riemerella anatipestifer]